MNKIDFISDILDMFSPSEEIRNIKESDFVGKIVTINLRYLNEPKTKQYITVEDWPSEEIDFLHISGWCEILGKEGGQLKREIKGFKLIEHMNGGRADNKRYSSYREFFNDERKKRVMSFWKGGPFAQLGTSGEPDKADIILEFDDFEIDSFAFEICAPEEWYSELHQKNSKFKFVDGFYKNADKAIEAFSQKSVDDIFGTRYFPVLVFPKDKLSVVKRIVQQAKNHSKSIVTNEYSIIGTRCKSYQYQNIISETYKEGGKVSIGLMWDWE